MAGNEFGDTVITVIAVYAVISAVGFWLATILWAFRDMGARSRDRLARLFIVLIVVALPFAGFLVYLFMRPRETLSEAYERSLEEEALLQEIEEKPSCPGCGQRIQDRWQACPNCHTRLKKPCGTCGNLLELSWKLCPYCAAPQRSYADADPMAGYNTPAAPERPVSEPRVSLSRPNPQAQTGYAGDPLEFVDDENY
jgi:RNA polymerase subunit RPABC4/transcription elongation factor Spt4